MKNVLGILCLSVLFFSFAFIGFAEMQKVQTNWENFGIGSWVLYEMQYGMQLKQTLMDKNDKEITIKSETIMNGQPMPASESKIPLEMEVSNTTEGAQAETKTYNEDIEVKGKVISAKVVESNTPQGLIQSYTSGNIPGGIIQTTVDGSVSMKLIDYEAK